MRTQLTFSRTAGIILVLTTALVILTDGQGGGSDTISARRQGNRQGGRRRSGSQSGDGLDRFGCEEIYLPMCKGLVPYTRTKLPNKFNHTTQLEVYRALEPLWMYMDHSCSTNTRLVACATYLPKCSGRRQPLPPCKRTCNGARRRCQRTLKKTMGFNWSDAFQCRGLTNRRCVRPQPEVRCQQEYPECVANEAINVCRNLSFTWGTMPNMFGQCRIEELNTEVEQYDALIATNCHHDLSFLLCGVYAPFCVRAEVPFTFPCREICDEIRTACEPHYRRLYHNLPWPQKLQCHRYPASDTEGFECVMPNEGRVFAGGK